MAETSTALTVFQDNKALVVRTPEDVERDRKQLAVMDKRERVAAWTTVWGTWGGLAIAGIVATAATGQPWAVFCLLGAIPGFGAGIGVEALMSRSSRDLRARVAEDKRLEEEAERKAESERRQRIEAKAKDVLTAALDEAAAAGREIRADSVNLRFNDPDRPDRKLLLRFRIEEDWEPGKPPLQRFTGHVCEASNDPAQYAQAKKIDGMPDIILERPSPAPRLLRIGGAKPSIVPTPEV